MHAGQDEALLRHLSRLTADPTAADRELLRRFAVAHDQDAFGELVRRHGPMVLRVCSTVLGREDAEDAFQAAFLVLARRAADVRWHDSVAGWLHGVARHVALKVRRAVMRRRAREHQAPPPASESVDVSLGEAQAVLDEELAGLAWHYRAPLVLCYLEGRTQDQAAAELGWSKSTCRRRLERGLALLKARLLRRGLGLSVLLLSAGLTRAVPPPLAAATVQSCLTPAVAPAPLLALADEAARATAPLGLKTIAVVLLSVCLAAGAGLFAFRATTAAPPAENRTESPPTEKVREPTDPLPQGVRFRLGSGRFRVPDGVNDAALSPDGKYLATTSKTAVVVWDLQTGRPVHHFRDCGLPDGFPGARVAFSPDGKRLAQVIWQERVARLWDLTTGKEALTISRREGQQLDHDSCVRFSANGKVLLSYPGGFHSPPGIRFWDAQTGRELRHIDLPGPPAAFSADGKVVACMTKKRLLWASMVLCDTETGKERARFQFAVPDKVRVYHATISADAALVAAGNGKDEVAVWDVAAGKEKVRIRLPADGPASPLMTLAFAPDGKTLVVGTGGGTIRRFDLATGKALPSLSGHVWSVTGLNFSGDGRTLYSTAWDNTVRRWDLATARELPLPDGYVMAATGSLSSDGRWVVLGDWSGRLDWWDARTGRLQRTSRPPGGRISRVAFSPDGKTLASAHGEGPVRFWEAASSRETGQLLLPAGSTWVLVWAPDGRRLLTRSGTDMRLWELGGKEVWHAGGQKDSVAAFSPDGKTLVTGGWDSTLAWRDAATGKVRREVKVVEAPGAPGEGTYIDSIAFSPDGRTVATAGHDTLVRLWDADTGRERKRLTGHAHVVWSVRFSPDGKRLVSSSCDHTVRTWDAQSGQELRRLVGHNGWVREASFGPDGETILSIAGPEVLLWDLRRK